MKAKIELTACSARNAGTTRNLAIWTGVWLISTAVAAFGPVYLWEARAASLLAIVISFCIGLGMLVSNIRHLQSLDEMMRKIQLEAMGLALGITVIAGISYSLLDITELIAADAEISFLVMLIGLSYIGAMFAGMRKYR